MRTIYADHILYKSIQNLYEQVLQKDEDNTFKLIEEHDMAVYGNLARGLRDQSFLLFEILGSISIIKILKLITKNGNKNYLLYISGYLQN